MVGIFHGYVSHNQRIILDNLGKNGVFPMEWTPPFGLDCLLNRLVIVIVQGGNHPRDLHEDV